MDLDADDDHHKLIYLDEAGFYCNLAKTRRRGRNLIGQRATIQVPGQRGANITMCVRLYQKMVWWDADLILDHIMQLSLSPFLMSSIRFVELKVWPMSLCGTMSGSIMLMWCKHGFRPMRNLPPCIYPHTLPSLTRLRNFSPHGDGRFMIGTLMNKSLFSRPCLQWHHSRPVSGLDSPWPKVFSKMFG